jgi:hypothetical protein
MIRSNLKIQQVETQPIIQFHEQWAVAHLEMALENASALNYTYEQLKIAIQKELKSKRTAAVFVKEKGDTLQIWLKTSLVRPIYTITKA